MTKFTVNRFKKRMDTGAPFATVTAYDATMAALVERAKIPLILVGDSVGMTQLGYETTVPVTIQDILHHTQAVRRGAPHTFIVADMPFASYHISDAEAIQNAAMLIQKGGADAVKLEGGATMAPLIQKMTQAGIPVLAHIGLLPQHVILNGGYFLRGKTPADIAELHADALAVQNAGAFAMVLEGVIPEVAAEITQKVRVPTIGIASGTQCDAHIQVLNDLIHLSTKPLPKHAHPYCDVAEMITSALTAYKNEVESADFGTK